MCVCVCVCLCVRVSFTSALDSENEPIGFLLDGDQIRFVERLRLLYALFACVSPRSNSVVRRALKRKEEKNAKKYIATNGKGNLNGMRFLVG